MPEKRGLGRGLSALIGDAIPPETGREQAASTAAPARPDRTVPIEAVVPNPDQPRRTFDEDDLNDLAQSISKKGILQPVLVRPKDGGYQIVAGERRWRAAQIAQLHDIPVIIRDFDDDEVLEVAIIENIQRADLNPVEEAMGYRQLMDRFGHTQEKMAEVLSKSRSHIANQLRLLNLPEEIQGMLRLGQISAGHARALLSMDNPIKVARAIVEKGLSVREAEKLARGGSAPKQTKRRSAPHKDADTIALEADLSATLGMRVSIEHEAGGESGVFSVRYKTLEDLDMICQALSQAEKMAH